MAASTRLVRPALELLPSERLIEIAERSGLDARGSAERLRRRIASSGRLNDEKLLRVLGASELHDLCRKIGVDPKSRERDVLVRRLRSMRPAASMSSARPTRARKSMHPVHTETVRARRKKQRQGVAVRIRSAFVGLVRGALGAAAGGGLAYLNLMLVSSHTETIETAAIVGAATAGFCGLFGRGRFVTAILYGGGVCLASYFTPGSDLAEFDLDLEGTGVFKVIGCWGGALVVGALLGLVLESAEEG